MKIALLRETKDPADNRVALTPQQAARLQQDFPAVAVVAQSSALRAFSDAEYRATGIPVVEDVSDCDLLLGIKEAAADSLLEGKHYVFFGHLAKMQENNRPLLQAMMQKGITFSDYEYMVDAAGERVCAFGWWAGVVGVYYTLRGYGLRTGAYSLPAPHAHTTLEELKAHLLSVRLPNVKMVLTGRGRTAHGAQFILQEIGACILPVDAYLATDAVDRLTCTFAYIDTLVRPKEGEGPVSVAAFHVHPTRYTSDFLRFALTSDILVSCHYWGPEDPVYLSMEDFRTQGFRIRMIGDITCDIHGSIQSTLRASTHADPYYDYNPVTGQEEPAFSSAGNVTVMAVDTCPNALPRDTSAYFGERFCKHVLLPFLQGASAAVLERSTILEKGRLTDRFRYLQPFAEGKQSV